MDGWGIGRTAAHFDVSPSTLRYYEQRGFLHPTRTSTGGRRYDRDQLRRIAFLRLGSSLGISLEIIASVLDEPGSRWRDELSAERNRIEAHLAAARNAADLLRATAGCRHAHLGRDCPELRRALDAVVDGADQQELAARYA